MSILSTKKGYFSIRIVNLSQYLPPLAVTFVYCSVNYFYFHQKQFIYYLLVKALQVDLDINCYLNPRTLIMVPIIPLMKVLSIGRSKKNGNRRKAR